MDFTRQLDILNPNRYLQFPINIVGLGGIGSPLGLALPKMGFSQITGWDFDLIEGHNEPNTIFPIGNIGKTKVSVLAKVTKSFTGVTLTQRPQRVNAETRFSGLVVSGVDNMDARRDIWQAIKNKASVPLYIDARMTKETFRILTVRPINQDDISFYEQTLKINDKDLPPTKCTEKAIIYNVFAIAGFVGAQIKKFAIGEPFPREIIFDLVTYTPIVNWGDEEEDTE